MNDKLQELEMEIANLRARLSSDVSNIGDWKVTKTYEARMEGKPDPYDTAELMKSRQEIRDKINELQAQIKALEEK